VSKERRKVRQGGCKGTSAKKVLEVEKGVWKSKIRTHASVKGLGLCNRTKRGML